MSAATSPSKHHFFRLLDLVLLYKGGVAFSILCMAGFNLFTAVPAYYAKDIVDALAYGEQPQLGQFILVGSAIILIFFLKGLCFFGQHITMGRIVQRLVAQLRQQLFDHVLGLSLSFFARSKTGDLIARFTNDLQVFQMTLNIGISGPFRDFPQIFIMIGIMIYRSWQLALMAMIIIPVAAYLILLFGKHNKIAVTDRQASFGGLTSLVMEAMIGIRVVKAFGMEGYERKRFEEANQHLYAHQMRSVLIASYSTPVIELVGATAGATMAAYGGYLIIQHQITAGDFASFFISFFMLNEPIKKLNGFNLKLQEGLAALKRVFQILDTIPQIREAAHPIRLPSFEKSIEVAIQKFEYPGEQDIVLRDIHITFQKGEVTALVGSSGAGKTTLVNLIPRFYDIEAGTIRIDGHELKQLEIHSLRSLIAMVTQETIIFNDTIANNIAYGQPDCPHERLIEAAKAAYAHDFILAQEHGYNTIVGERGIQLSGGQRQRLAIARAILKNAPILILDEATSALDPESEIAVQQALEHLMNNRTSIVIAHRLSTIRHAHHILVLEKGLVVEQGTHDVLLQQSGRYKELYSSFIREGAADEI